MTILEIVGKMTILEILAIVLNVLLITKSGYDSLSILVFAINILLIAASWRFRQQVREKDIEPRIEPRIKIEKPKKIILGTPNPFHRK